MAEAVDFEIVAGSHLRGLRGEAGEDRLRPRLVPEDTTTRYAQRLRNDDFVYEFVVYNPVGPQCVFTEAPDGTRQFWKHYWQEKGVLVFVAPDGYAGGAFVYFHTPLQKAEPLREQSTKLFSFGEDHDEVA